MHLFIILSKIRHFILFIYYLDIFNKILYNLFENNFLKQNLLFIHHFLKIVESKNVFLIFPTDRFYYFFVKSLS